MMFTAKTGDRKSISESEVSTDTETEDNDTELSDVSESDPHLTPTPSSHKSAISRDANPDENISRRLRSVSWGSESQTGDEAGSESSITSPQINNTEPKRRSAVWIKEDGEYFLDKGKTCKLGYINEHIGRESAANIQKELSDAIEKECTPKNKLRYKIVFQHGGESKPSDVVSNSETKAKKSASTKISELSMNLQETSDLCSLIKSYQERLSKTVKEVFQLHANFDQTAVYRMSGQSHSIPYESADNNESGNFSPIVAVLALGLKTARPMFVKTKAGNQVTHKIVLLTGTLCVLSGRSEKRYRRSIPRDWGPEDEHYFLVFTQKSPVKNGPHESPTINTPTIMQREGDKDDNHELVTKEELPVQSSNTEIDVEPSSPKKEEVKLSSPPSVIRIASIQDNLKFKDELLNGMSFSRLESPTDVTEDAGRLRDDIKTVSNAQKCVQNTLKHVVDSIVTIKTDITSLKEVSKKDSVSASCTCDSNEIGQQLKDLTTVIANLKKSIGVLEKPKELASTVKKCSEKIDELMTNIQGAKDDMKLIRKDLKKLRTKAVDAVKEAAKDIENYHNSIFCDETTSKIEDIHKFVTTYQSEEATQTEPLDPVQVNTRTSQQSTSNVVGPSPAFAFPERIEPSLKTLVESGKRLNAWLITDSIMRHVSESSLEFRKYILNFQRIDCTCSEALSFSSLETGVSEEKPHLIYVHLGINDIQKGEDTKRIIEHFKKFDEMLRRVSPATRLIISCPLLNGKNNEDSKVFALRRSLSTFVNQERDRNITTRRLFLERNEKFFTGPKAKRRQNPKYFQERDRLHLSERGKSAITCTIRHSINRILKEFHPDAY